MTSNNTFADIAFLTIPRQLMMWDSEPSLVLLAAYFLYKLRKVENLTVSVRDLCLIAHCKRTKLYEHLTFLSSSHFILIVCGGHHKASTYCAGEIFGDLNALTNFSLLKHGVNSTPGERILFQRMTATNSINCNELCAPFNSKILNDKWIELREMPKWREKALQELRGNINTLKMMHEDEALQKMQMAINGGYPAILPSKSLPQFQAKSVVKHPAVSDDDFSTESVNDPAPSKYRKEIRRRWIALAKSISSDVIGASTAYFVRKEGMTTIKVHCCCGHSASGNYSGTPAISNNP